MATTPAGKPSQNHHHGRVAKSWQVDLSSVPTDQLVSFLGLPKAITIVEFVVVITDDDGGSVTRTDPRFFLSESTTIDTSDYAGQVNWSGTPGRYLEASAVKRMTLPDGSLYIQPNPDAADGDITLRITIVEGYLV